MQKLNEKNLLRELSLIISEGEKRDQMLAGYDEVNEKLGDAGASERFARMMIDELSRFRGRIKIINSFRFVEKGNVARQNTVR